MGIYKKQDDTVRIAIESKKNDRRDKQASNQVSRLISLIDQQVCKQLNEIIHHPKFQALEASWRGVLKLVDLAEIHDNIKIRLLDASWRDVSRDIERAPDFDQSHLFNLIYNAEFGIAGGQPFSVLLGDYQVCHKSFEGHSYDDVYTLNGLSHIAASAFAPFICSASPKLFGLDSFEDFGSHINIPAIFEQNEYIRWRRMREQEDMRFVSITLPSTLMREPYNTNFSHRGGIRFQENCSGFDNKKYLWGNACYAFGSVLIRAFIDIGWFSHLRGAPRDEDAGGLVSRFPAIYQDIDSSNVVNKPLTEVVITDQCERDLSDQGILSLCQVHQAPFAIFQNCVSLQKVKEYGSKSANANARISAMLQQVLCASRFAQYIKVMIREKIGAYLTAAECERYIQHWLDKYSTGRDDLEWDMKARYPLRDARVRVYEDPSKPGSFQSVIHLRTHYTADHLISELKLTTAIQQTGITAAV